MSTREAPRAAARADVRSSAAGSPARRRPDSADRLRRLSDRLDTLLRDVSVDARSQREHERRVDEAEAIAAELTAIFRKPAPAAVHPPLWHEGGRAAW